MPVDLSVGPPPAPETKAESGPSSDAPPFAEPVEAELVPEVDETVVRALLKGLGHAASAVGADEDVPDQWKFTDAELDSVTPPLTRIINRRPKWRAAVARGDEAVVVLVLASYGGRNVADGRRAKEARENDGQPTEADGAAGHARAAPGGTGQGYAGGNGRGPGLHQAADRSVP